MGVPQCIRTLLTSLFHYTSPTYAHCCGVVYLVVYLSPQVPRPPIDTGDIACQFPLRCVSETGTGPQCLCAD
ncbi:hypothetical protein F5Y12DRAFT_736915 [Xylaria sp. FL1777]|nr:hypothetical protein F5Y12DRAFT_736915 [Xylaria sp. FL1777]